MCGNDDNKSKYFQTCLGKDPAALIQNCGATYPGRPYCVNGVCRSDPDPKKPECTSGFTCTNEGYFPSMCQFLFGIRRIILI